MLYSPHSVTAPSGLAEYSGCWFSVWCCLCSESLVVVEFVEVLSEALFRPGTVLVHRRG